MTVSDLIRFVSKAVLEDKLSADAELRMPDDLVITSLSLASDGSALYFSDAVEGDDENTDDRVARVSRD